MLDVRIPTISKVQGRVMSQGYPFPYVSTFASVDNPVTWETVQDPRAGSKLIQGDAFDGFYNKSVYHAHVDLTGTLLPDDADTAVAVESPSVPQHYTLVVAPLLLYVQGTVCRPHRERFELLMDSSDLAAQDPPYAGYITGYGGTFHDRAGRVIPWWGYASASWSRNYDPDLLTISIDVRRPHYYSHTGYTRSWKVSCGLTQKTAIGTAVAMVTAYSHLNAALLESLAYQKWGSEDVTWYGTTWSPEAPILTPSGARAKGHRIASQYLDIAINMPYPDEDWGHLAAEAVNNQADFSSNMIAYLQDLKSFGSTLQAIYDLPRGKINVKKVAGAWLSSRYGDRLTISDTKELARAMSQVARRAFDGYTIGRSLSRQSFTRRYFDEWYDGEMQSAACIICSLDSKTGLMTAIKRLMDWDLWPSLENTWDMIPYTFCVDWLCNVSNLLDAIDTAIKAPYLVPLTQYASRRLALTRRTGGDIATRLLKVTLVKYQRAPRELLGEISPLDASLDPTFSAVNLLDGIALAFTA